MLQRKGNREVKPRFLCAEARWELTARATVLKYDAKGWVVNGYSRLEQNDGDVV